jgi:hypothetical protein
MVAHFIATHPLRPVERGYAFSFCAETLTAEETHVSAVEVFSLGASTGAGTERRMHEDAASALDEGMAALHEGLLRFGEDDRVIHEVVSNITIVF